MNKITISGVCGSGKTTIAIYIKDLLEARGFSNIMLHDSDVTFGSDYPHLQEKRLSVLKDTPIIIETIHVHR